MFTFMQMDTTNLEMNGIKSSSFNVKDLLDLPADKAVVAAAGELSGLPAVPDVTAPPPYYDADNPYTRWLHSNENLHYNCKYFAHCFSPAESHETHKKNSSGANISFRVRWV